MLVALLERPREVITRDELRQRLGLLTPFRRFDHGLNTTINKLRESLGDSASNPRFIQTLPRRGYRFLAVVDRVRIFSPLRLQHPPTPRKLLTAIPNRPNHGYESSIVEGGCLQSSATTRSLRTSRDSTEDRRNSLRAAAIDVCGVLRDRPLCGGSTQKAGWRMERYLGISARTVVITVMISAAVGLAVRLYTLSQVALKFRWLTQFRKIFPIVLIVDVV